MTDESIFQDKKPDSTSDQKVEQDNQPKGPDYDAIFRDKLTGIKNDQGEQKYTDVLTALEALKYSQEHIKTLESENKALKDENLKHQTMEEALDRITTEKNQNTQPTEPSKKDIDVEELRKIVREENSNLTKENQAKQNRSSVSSSLISKYGTAEKAIEAFSKKAEELGVTYEFLQDLAGNSPKAVLAYFNETSSQVFNKNVQGSVNTESFNKQESKEPKISGVMYGASSKDMLSAWKAAGDYVKAEMNK